MKFINIVFLIFIGLITCKQEFVNSGTGLKGVSHQKKLKGMAQGSLFMTLCVIGGLGSDDEILEAKKWCVLNKYVRDKDNYVKIDRNTLAK